MTNKKNITRFKRIQAMSEQIAKAVPPDTPAYAKGGELPWPGLTAATLVFALQNLGVVTMSFLGFSARAPFAFLIAVAYLLGAATGGSLFALLRRSVKGSGLSRTDSH